MQTDLLTDTRFRGSQKKDLALVSNAVRRFGESLREAGPEMVDRLRGIVNKTSVQVVTEDGDLIESEAMADENSMRAVEILGKLIVIEQKDDHHADKLAAPKPQTNVNVQVNNGGAIGSVTDSGGGRASAILERLRLARLSGQPAG